MTQSNVRLLEAHLTKLSHVMALLGGLIMLSLAIITVASIIGRTFFGQSVEGDYELTEVGLAIAVFLFLPECYLRKGHVIVDLFTANCRPTTIRFLDKSGDFLFTAASVLFAYRLALAGMESKEYWEQTMILELQLWWVYLTGVISFSICALCGLSHLLSRSYGESHE